jgi:flavin reductase (DIM6/NTAB) family NADH-FMN oxidoreductase RutF
MIELDLLRTHADRAYPVLASLVTPRPIAWVTTRNEDGSVNAAPFSFFNVFGAEPPLVIFAPGDREDGTAKDTARNCERTGEFVINFVDAALAEAMVRTAASLPYGVSETEREQLETAASSSIATPRIAAAPAALECKVHEIQRIGQNRLVLGIVHRVQIREEYFDADKLRVLGTKFHPIGRMAVPDWYCRTDAQFELKRPEWGPEAPRDLPLARQLVKRDWAFPNPS